MISLNQPSDWFDARWSRAIKAMESLRDSIMECKEECPLHPSNGYAKCFVPGYGSPASRIFFLGEAPGEDEDNQGYPFVGRSGELLNQMLSDVGIARGDVWVTNVVRCRPPNNRDPKYAETTYCSKWYNHEFDFIRPEVVVAIGRIAKNFVLPSVPNITSSHGIVYDIAEKMSVDDGIIDMRHVHYFSIYHPSWIIRNGGVGSVAYKTAVGDLENLIDLIYDKKWTR